MESISRTALSLLSQRDNLRYSLRDNSLRSVYKIDSTPNTLLEDEDDDEYEDDYRGSPINSTQSR